MPRKLARHAKIDTILGGSVRYGASRLDRLCRGLACLSPITRNNRSREMLLRGIFIFRGVVAGVAEANEGSHADLECCVFHTMFRHRQKPVSQYSTGDPRSNACTLTLQFVWKAINCFPHNFLSVTETT